MLQFKFESSVLLFKQMYAFSQILLFGNDVSLLTSSSPSTGAAAGAIDRLRVLNMQNVQMWLRPIVV